MHIHTYECTNKLIDWLTYICMYVGMNVYNYNAAIGGRHAFKIRMRYSANNDSLYMDTHMEELLTVYFQYF